MTPRQKAKDLIALAINDKTPEKERVVAAIQAVAIINKYELLESPLDGIVDDETVLAGKNAYRAGKKIFDASKIIAEALRGMPTIRRDLEKAGERIKRRKPQPRTRARYRA